MNAFVIYRGPLILAFVGLAIGVSIITMYLLPEYDNIHFSSPTPNEKAVLVDGRKGGVFQNDWATGVISAATKDQIIGEFKSTSPQAGEVIAFSHGKAPFLKTNIPWTNYSDNVDVDFDDVHNIEVKVWLLTDGAFSIKGVIENYHCKKAHDIWLSEGHGLQVNCTITDARDVFLNFGGVSQKANQWFSGDSFNCDDHAPGIQNASGAYVAGVLNVYYVNEVHVLVTARNQGVHCNNINLPDVIALGVGSGDGILAHEIGHALIGNGVEDHIDELSPSPQCATMPALCTTSLPNNPKGLPSFFDRTNVMHGASSWRATLTEGQVFRAFFNSSSALNNVSIYNLGMGIRVCGGVGQGTYVPPDHTPECPQLEKRLWPDNGGEYGTWPTN